MAKHITAQILKVDGFNKSLLKVTVQTNICTAFGNSADGKTFTASNGITLGSNLRPARDKDFDDTIWLRGVDASKNGADIALPAKRLQRVIDAIKEYNAYYTTDAINARVRAKKAAEARQAELDRQAALRRQAAVAAAYRFAAPAPKADPCCCIIG